MEQFLQASNHGGADAFVAELNATGSALVYSTYLGGSGNDYGNGIAVNSSGDAYVTGRTLSTDFPTVDPIQANLHGLYDAFVARIVPASRPTEPSTGVGHGNQAFQDEPALFGSQASSQTRDKGDSQR